MSTICLEVKCDIELANQPSTVSTMFPKGYRVAQHNIMIQQTKNLHYHSRHPKAYHPYAVLPSNLIPTPKPTLPPELIPTIPN